MIDRIKYLEDEVETLRMQLVACGIATFQNTEATRQHRLEKDDKYWSVPYNDVCISVDREIRLRKQLSEAISLLQEVRSGGFSHPNVERFLLGVNK